MRACGVSSRSENNNIFHIVERQFSRFLDVLGVKPIANDAWSPFLETLLKSGKRPVASSMRTLASRLIRGERPKKRFRPNGDRSRLSCLRPSISSLPDRSEGGRDLDRFPAKRSSQRETDELFQLHAQSPDGRRGAVPWAYNHWRSRRWFWDFEDASGQMRASTRRVGISGNDSRQQGRFPSRTAGGIDFCRRNHSADGGWILPRRMFRSGD